MAENDKQNLARVREHKLILLNRKNLSITGLESVASVNSTVLNLRLSGVGLTVMGADLHIVKLDVEQGNIEIEGVVDNMRYTSQNEKLSLLKRLFK